jgi:hypothetical protein
MNTDDISISEMSIQKFPGAGKRIPFVQAILDFVYRLTQSKDQSLKTNILLPSTSPSLPPIFISFLFVHFKRYVQAAGEFIGCALNLYIKYNISYTCILLTKNCKITAGCMDKSDGQDRNFIWFESAVNSVVFRKYIHWRNSSVCRGMLLCNMSQYIHMLNLVWSSSGRYSIKSYGLQVPEYIPDDDHERSKHDIYRVFGPSDLLYYFVHFTKTTDANAEHLRLLWN